MKKDDIIVVYLTIVLWITIFLWIKAEKRAAYLDGRESIYRQTVVDFNNQTIGNCYSKGGCNDDELFTVSHSENAAQETHTKKRKK